MKTFDYVRAATVEEALEANRRGGTYLAGGTNLVDHLKLGISSASLLVDIRGLDFGGIHTTPDGGVSIGAGVTNSELAHDRRIKTQYPALSQALLAGASPQLRNVATVAGNLMQGTRCGYYRDGISPCNKRAPGSGCSAIEGFNRAHALFGTSDRCIATHPSDMAVALVALDAVVRTRRSNGERSMPLSDLFIPYGEDPAKENVLEPGELITSVELPGTGWFGRSTYVKARDRSSFEFALASAAVAVDLAGGTITDCRIALGGVATKPWRAFRAESALRGLAPTQEAFREAANAELELAVPQKDNEFKIELCRRVLSAALGKVCDGAR